MYCGLLKKPNEAEFLFDRYMASAPGAFLTWYTLFSGYSHALHLYFISFISSMHLTLVSNTNLCALSAQKPSDAASMIIQISTVIDVLYFGTLLTKYVWLKHLGFCSIQLIDFPDKFLCSTSALV
jgi:hypothetical protein